MRCVVEDVAHGYGSPRVDLSVRDEGLQELMLVIVTVAVLLFFSLLLLLSSRCCYCR